jgi:hypothetical protein
MSDNKHPTVLHLGDASSIATLKLLNRLAELGWRVHLISHKPRATNITLNTRLTVHRLPVKPVYPLTYIAYLAAAPMIMSIKPSIIHAHYLTSFGIMAAVHRRFLRFKLMVLTACGPDVIVDARGGMIRWSAKHALKMFEIITGDNEEVIEALQKLEAPMERIERIDWATGNPDQIATAADRLDALYNKLISGD